MSGTFGNYGIAARALQAFQTGLDVTGNNITNVNTIGYTRQSVDFTQSNSLDLYGAHLMQLGQGVSVQTISRIRDTLLDASMWNSQSDMGKFQTLAGTLESVQGAFPEPGENGISAALNKFFNAWSSLASNPGDAGAKLAVQQAGSTLAGKIRGTYSDLQSLSGGIQQQLDGAFNDVDKLTAEIASLNKQIASNSANGGQPNELLDERTQDLEKLSQLVSIKAYNNADGSVTVYSNSLALVDQAGSNAIPRTVDSANGILKGASVDMGVPSGKIAGLIQGMSKISDYKGRLDSLANSLRSQVNSIHRTGTNAAGGTGNDFFNYSPSPAPQTAADFDLALAVKADANAIASGASGKPGDGGLALTISRLTTASVAALGGQTIGGFYSSLVDAIGSDSAGVAQAQDTQGAVMQQIDAQRQAVAGVNVDEEMANMLRFQRSYQAAAKALSIFDQNTETIIGLIK